MKTGNKQDMEPRTRQPLAPRFLGYSGLVSGPRTIFYGATTVDYKRFIFLPLLDALYIPHHKVRYPVPVPCAHLPGVAK